jgi:hypothetical protein
MNICLLGKLSGRIVRHHDACENSNAKNRPESIPSIAGGFGVHIDAIDSSNLYNLV